MISHTSSSNQSLDSQQTQDSSNVESKIAKVKTEIEKAREMREQACWEHEKSLKVMQSKLSTLKTRLFKSRQDIRKDFSVHKYAALLKNDTTPSSILILQANLCRQVHQVFMEKAQLKLMTDNLKDLSAFADKQVSDLIQQKMQLEVEMLNKMAEVQNQEKEYQENCQKRILDQSLEVVKIQEKLGGGESTLDKLANRISDLNHRLQTRDMGGSEEKQDAKPQEMSRRDAWRMKAMQKSVTGLPSDGASDSRWGFSLSTRSLSKFSTSLRNIGSSLSTGTQNA